MTHLDDAKARLAAWVHSTNPDPVDDPLSDDIQMVLEALGELEDSYVPHLPAETDTWLRDSQDITLDHPLPPGSKVRFFYGPGRDQFLTVRATDQGLRVQSDHGWVTITPAAPNSVSIIGSVK